MLKAPLIWFVVLCNTLAIIYLLSQQAPDEVTEKINDEIPNLVGTWQGENVTVSDLKGYRVWGEKRITITEQRDRRFRGSFTYPDGTKHFFGVIYPDNQTFTWVASNSKGYNHGKILDANSLAACYFESWEEATAGCATLMRQ